MSFVLNNGIIVRWLQSLTSNLKTNTTDVCSRADSHIPCSGFQTYVHSRGFHLIE